MTRENTFSNMYPRVFANGLKTLHIEFSDQWYPRVTCDCPVLDKGYASSVSSSLPCERAPSYKLFDKTQKQFPVLFKTKKVISGPIWKRRGAKPIPDLQLDYAIRCDITWKDKLVDMDESLQIVQDSEWVMRYQYFEAHPMEDIVEGVVINPPTYPIQYQVVSTGKIVPAQLPFAIETLFIKAQFCGYYQEKLIKSMGTVAGNYAAALIHPKKRNRQEVLILAGQHWQGSAGIYAGYQSIKMGVKATVYIHGAAKASAEEFEFVRAGGNVCRRLSDLKGKRFRVVVVALENHGFRESSLPLFGEWLENAVSVFIDPPVLRGTYTDALQVACNGSYNICQKTAIFVPALPKSYVIDKFIDVYVVDVGISEEMHAFCGVEYFSFPKKKRNTGAELVVPQPFVAKGSKIYYYQDGKLCY